MPILAATSTPLSSGLLSPSMDSVGIPRTTPASNGITEIAASNRDVFVRPATSPENTTDLPKTTPPKNLDLGIGYKLKQCGTDALIVGGSIAAIALLLSPEPFITKILGAILAFVCILGGAGLKHYFFKQAYLTQGLEAAVGKLGNKIDQLNGEISALDSVRQKLDATNSSLQTTKDEFDTHIGSLKKQVDRLKVDVNQAFDELNVDRAIFEREKNAKLAQLNDEIAEADARGNRAQKKLDGIYARESKLNEFEAELESRRKAIVEAETKLQDMRAALLRRSLNR